MSQTNSDLVNSATEVDFSEFLKKAESDTSFGFPSYILKHGNRYERYNTGDGQYYFDASRKNATRHNYEEASQIVEALKRLRSKDIEIEVDDSSDIRASNAFWEAIYQKEQIKTSASCESGVANAQTPKVVAEQNHANNLT